MSTDAPNVTGWGCRVEGARQSPCDAIDVQELRRARNYPVSRWYLRPAAARLARLLASTPIRPVQLTLCGLTAAVAASAVLLWYGEATLLAALLVLLYWFFDRADGLLARRQKTASVWGAWLDGNVDELVDVGLHVATAAVIARQVAAPWPWHLLIAWLAGKYLLMYGLSLEPKRGHSTFPTGTVRNPREKWRWLRFAYHLPGNADVRVHLLVAALATGCLAAELAFVAAYYNMRWIVRYGPVARRLGGAP